MTHDTDRIAVPTNGSKPHRASSGTPLAPLRGEPPTAETGETSDAALSVAFSPKQLAIGFGVLASLVLLVAGAVRRRSGR